MKMSEYVLSTMLKVIIMCEHYQDLTNNAAKLVWYNNNDWKVKHDYLKKLTVLNIW